MLHVGVTPFSVDYLVAHHCNGAIFKLCSYVSPYSFYSCYFLFFFFFLVIFIFSCGYWTLWFTCRLLCLLNYWISFNIHSRIFIHLSVYFACWHQRGYRGLQITLCNCLFTPYRNNAFTGNLYSFIKCYSNILLYYDFHCNMLLL